MTRRNEVLKAFCPNHTILEDKEYRDFDDARDEIIQKTVRDIEEYYHNEYDKKPVSLIETSTYCKSRKKSAFEVGEPYRGEELPLRTAKSFQELVSGQRVHWITPGNLNIREISFNEARSLKAVVLDEIFDFSQLVGEENEVDFDSGDDDSWF